jgi:ketosteroid isomerase-like protein
VPSREGTRRLERAAELYEVWNAEGVDGVADRFWSESIEWRDDVTIPDADVYSGREEVRRHIAERVDLLGHFRIQLERVADVGEAEVLAIYEVVGTGGQSGVPWRERMAEILRFSGDRVIEVQDYLDVDRALEAAGLSERLGP